MLAERLERIEAILQSSAVASNGHQTLPISGIHSWLHSLRCKRIRRTELGFAVVCH